MQLRHHALRQFPDLAGAPDGGLGKKAFRLRAVESRMHAREVVESLPNPHPARKHGDIGNEAGIAHELIALGPGVMSKHLQFSLIGGESENRVERGSFACAVGTDESENPALFHPEIDAIHRDRCAEGLAEAACFYACHVFSAPSWGNSTRAFSTLCHPKMACCLRHPAVLPPSARAAESLRGPWAILRQETSAVRPAATNCVRRH